MNTESLKRLIKDTLREAQSEGVMRPTCCGSCALEPGEHGRHHQMLKEACTIRKQVFGAVVTCLVGGGLVWLGLAVWEKLVRQVLK